MVILGGKFPKLDLSRVIDHLIIGSYPRKTVFRSFVHFKETFCEKMISIHDIWGSFLVVMVLESPLKDACNSHNLTKHVQP